jgi:hypothetical protein
MTFPFKGKISDVRFWNTVRTSEEINADKNNSLPAANPFDGLLEIE